MPNDPLAGLFKRGLKIDLPSEDRERHARRLATLNLIRLDEISFVRCVNPVDRDQKFVKDRDCPGRVYLDLVLDENDHQYRCSDCNRVIFPARKKKTLCLRIVPNDRAVAAAVAGQIRAAGFEATERPRGLFRIASDNGQVDVCLVDHCREPAILMEGYRGQVVFVVANDRDFLFRFEGRPHVFRLVDLVLGQAGRVFQRRLRELVRADNRDAPPAIMSLSPLVMSAREGAPQVGDVPLAPPGTKWEQVAFYYIDGETLALRIANDAVRRVGPRDLRLADGRGGRATAGWRLLVELCEGDRTAPWSGGGGRSWRARVQCVSQLKATLQGMFGIHDEPFESHTRDDGLRAAFQAFSYAPGARDRARAIDESEIERELLALGKKTGTVASSTTPRPAGTSRLRHRRDG